MPSPYVDQLAKTMDNIINTGYPLHAHGLAKRSAFWITCPLVCMPCGIWSCVLRFVACPVQCLFKGGGYACSNNGCTNFSDQCIVSCVQHINEPVFPVTFDASKASIEDSDAVMMIIAKLIVEFTSVRFSSHHYVLCDFCVRPLTGNLHVLPNNAVAVLNKLMILLKARKAPVVS